MSVIERIRHARHDTSHCSRGGGPLQLPSEVLALARERVGKFALFCSLFFAVGAVSALMHAHAGRDAGTLALVWGVLAALFTLDGLGLFWLSKRSQMSDLKVLKLGLVLELVVVLFVNVVAIEVTWALHGRLPDMTLGPVFIVFFPLLVPLPAAKNLIGGLAAAAMAPLALTIMGNLRGVDTTLASGWLFGSHLLAVVMAVFAATVIQRMGRELARAQQLGSYALEEKVGSGGMGEVWRARHRLLTRPAAIKLIRPDVVGSAADRERIVERFRREAQVTATLDSPHTVELYDFGVADDGSFFYVMELLDGLDLERLVADHGPLPPERVVHLLRQACDSLADAHERELVHRDIKPANLFVCRRGLEVDYLKVLDFGMVALQGARVGDGARLTQERGAFGGTPAYMAPEAAAGEDTGDGRGDLYALGCVAYYLLTGELVFEGSTPLQLVLKHVNETPRPISEVSEVDVPPALEALVMRCLAKDPAARPRSAEELSRELGAIRCDAPWGRERALGWWQKHRPDLVSPRTTTAEALATPNPVAGAGRVPGPVRPRALEPA